MFSAEEAVMRIQAEEYLHCIVDQVAFKVNVLAMVAETKQTFADHDDFRLRRPDLKIEVQIIFVVYFINNTTQDSKRYIS